MQKTKHQKTVGLYRLSVGTVILLLVTCLAGCEKKTDQLSNENTYHKNNATVASENSFTYYSGIEFAKAVSNELNQVNHEGYSSVYQHAARQQLELLKDKKTYTIENPLMIHNPFQTNECGLYIYLGIPEKKVNVFYQISIEDTSIPDYTTSMYINRITSNEVEGQIIGLIPGYVNKVVIDIRGVDGSKIDKRAYYIDVPADSVQTEISLKLEEREELTLSRGLFGFLSHNQNASYYLFYDNKGILRAEIPTQTDNEKAKLLQVENQIFYQYDDNEYVMADNLGNIINYYKWEGNSYLREYDLDSANQMVLFLESTQPDGPIERIIQLDLAKKEWNELCNLKKLIPDYEQILTKNQGRMSINDTTDFFRMNSIQCANGKDILLCSKELSTIFRINNIYYYPVIRWMIGDEEFWKDTEYESLLLYETQSKTNKSGMDSLTFFTNKQLKDGQSYLAFINYSPDKENTAQSQVIKYLVDENQNRYREVQNILFAPHTGECSAMIFGNHVVLSLGLENQFIEYNEEGEIMLRFTKPSMNSSYQVIKYIMDRYWF